MSYVIYGLRDPRDGMFHYVGYTDDVYRRFTEHVKGSAGNLEKNMWIFECRKANLMIAMVELERIEMLESAQNREKYWIRHYLDLGHPLSNIQDTRASRQRKKDFVLEDYGPIVPLPPSLLGDPDPFQPSWGREA